MKETKQSKMNEDDPPKTKSELETHPEDSTARHRRVRLGRRRTGTKPETKVGRGIEPATGREERTVGDRKRQRN